MQTDLFAAATTEHITLRDYQDRAVCDVLNNITDNPILVAPTGSGKTVMGCDLMRRFGGRVLWLAHRTELIDQAVRSIQDVTHTVPGIIKAGRIPTPGASVQVASVQTLIRRSLPAVDLVIVDECHHATAPSYQTILTGCNAPVVGLTATPFRIDGKGLGSAGFKRIIVAAYTDELCARGVLHAPKVYVGRAPSLKGVRIEYGDYKQSQLSQAVNDGALVGDVVGTWKSKAAGKRTVAFAVDVEHSKAIYKAFWEAGVPAAHVDGKTPADERDEATRKLRDGKIQVLCNCMVFTEGWDLPALECAIIARPTASLNLHWQIIGRIMRVSEGKDGCVVLDHAGNHDLHGLVTRRLDYTLDGSVNTGEKDPLGMRRCKDCFLLFDSKLTECPECGWKYVPEARELRHASGELQEYVEDYPYRAGVYARYADQGEAMGFKPGWAAYRYKERFGDWPVVVSGKLLNPDHADETDKREVYRQFVQTATQKGMNIGWASHRYKGVFGVWPKGFVEEVKAEFSAVDRKPLQNKWNTLIKGGPPKRVAAAVAVAVESDEDEEWTF